MTDVLHELVLPKLDGIRRSGAGYTALCPAHDDRNPSLSVAAGTDQPVILHCQAGCDRDDILTALGLTWEQVCKPRGRPDRPTVIATYEYTDEHGQVLFVKERLVPKDFRQKRPNGKGGWTWKLGDTRRVLYRLPQVLEAIRDGHTVYLVEGEKDVHAAERAGAVATCNFDGAAKGNQRPKWRPEYGDMLKGAHVIIVADNDEAGLAHARAAYTDLDGKAMSVRIVRGLVDTEHADLSDHLAAGHALDELVPIGDEPVTPDTPTAPEDLPEGEEAATDPVAELIAELLDTDDLDNIPALEPLIADVLFRDTVARMWGESGAFKSFMAVDFAACVGTGLNWHGQTTRQGLVIYLVAEGGGGIRKRVRAWEQHHGRKATGVRFLPRPVQARSPEWAVLIEACRRLRPAMIVIDTQARVTVGIEENSATEMGVFLDQVERLRAACQACVLLVHHSGLSGERGRGSTAIKGGMQTELSVSRSGKTLDTIRVTLKTTKQKDDEELGDLVFVLERVELKGEAKPDGTPVTSVVLVPAPGFGIIPGSVEDTVAKLDAAGISPDLGRDTTRTEATKLGIPLPGNTTLAQAVRIRKNRTNGLSSGAGTGPRFKPVLIPGTVDGVPADQTCPGQVGDSTGQAESGPVLSPPSLRRGQDGQPGHPCEACGQPTNNAGDSLCPACRARQGLHPDCGFELNSLGCKEKCGSRACQWCGDPLAPGETAHPECGK